MAQLVTVAMLGGKEDGDLSEERLQPDENDQDRRAEFARVFAEHDRWLYAYLVSMLGNPVDAQEVFQEVCVTIWKDYQQFQLGTSFHKWSSVVALNQVRKFRRQRKRQPAVLSDETMEVLAVEAIERVDLMDARRQALHGCLEKLRPVDRELIQLCYSGACESFRDVAERLGRPSNTVYKALNRIRRSLHDCIERRIATDKGR
ncbi:MAG: sigma-70 family RNA polymerase sigma factor [Planctomycetales bacterium]|nr:sigma-70 family RNA polymerase sigma factor [Planctomycetales bacterium]